MRKVRGYLDKMKKWMSNSKNVQLRHSIVEHMSNGIGLLEKILIHHG